MQKKSCYGNETKLRLENYYSPDILEQMSTVLSAKHFIVVNASYWFQSIPWNVPERTISDNLIVIVKSGKLHAETLGQKTVLTPGDCMFVPEFTPHSYGFPEGVREAETFILHVLCDYHPNINLFRCLKTPFVHLRHWEAKEEELLRIVALRNKENHLAFSCAEQLLKRIFVELIEEKICPVSQFAYRDPRIEYAMEFMRKNLTVNCSMQDIAATANLKEVQFRRLFRQECGISPGTWIQRLRMLHSLRLLTRGNAPLATIAQNSGFNSLTYFCNSFKKFYNLTPEQYRKRNFSDR